MKFPGRRFVSYGLVVVPGRRSSGTGVERSASLATSRSSGRRRWWGKVSRATAGRRTGPLPTRMGGRRGEATVAILARRGRESWWSPLALRADRRRRRGKVGFILGSGIATGIRLQLAFSPGIVGSWNGEFRLYLIYRVSSSRSAELEGEAAPSFSRSFKRGRRPSSPSLFRLRRETAWANRRCDSSGTSCWVE